MNLPSRIVLKFVMVFVRYFCILLTLIGSIKTLANKIKVKVHVKFVQIPLMQCWISFFCLTSSSFHLAFTVSQKLNNSDKEGRQ